MLLQLDIDTWVDPKTVVYVCSGRERDYDSGSFMVKVACRGFPAIEFRHFKEEKNAIAKAQEMVDKINQALHGEEVKEKRTIRKLYITEEGEGKHANI